MRDKIAIAMLGALAQEHRLRIFRMLVKAGPTGMPSSQIAARANIGATGASFHLKELVHAGLAQATRQGRFIVYAVRVDAVRQLLGYLTEDCCQGQPELCGSAFKSARNACAVKGECK